VTLHLFDQFEATAFHLKDALEASLSEAMGDSSDALKEDVEGLTDEMERGHWRYIQDALHVQHGHPDNPRRQADLVVEDYVQDWTRMLRDFVDDNTVVDGVPVGDKIRDALNEAMHANAGLFAQMLHLLWEYARHSYMKDDAEDNVNNSVD